MNLCVRTRNPSKCPDKSGLPVSSHHDTDHTFTGTRVGVTLKKTGRPGVNIWMFWDKIESDPGAQTVMLYSSQARVVFRREDNIRHSLTSSKRKTTRFLQHDSGTNSFFFSDESLWFLNVDVWTIVFSVNVDVVLLGIHPPSVCETSRSLHGYHTCDSRAVWF